MKMKGEKIQMEKAINGLHRRKHIIEMLKQSDGPLSGTILGKENEVSRQVIVQDITLLRAEGYDIVATPRGYILNASQGIARVIKTFHTAQQTEEELTTIVDLGGVVLDTMVNHKAYGKISVPLNVRNRRDIQVFINQITSGKSGLISNVTSGFHFHKITAESEEILDEIEDSLRKKGMLAEILSYEKEITEIS